jgi:1-acyl-sn-glycerol-3-phosphate acyltransferase
MFLVTHIIVFFYLFPIGTIRILVNPANAPKVKKEITGLLFTIIGQKPKVLGAEQVLPNKNYLIVSNYPGSYAGFALMNTFPDAAIVVHSFFVHVPLVGWLLKSCGAIFVHQKRVWLAKRAIDEKLKLIANKSMIILPEGGRTPNGLIHEFRRGFIYILKHSSLDLLPVTLKGFYRLKPLKRPYLDPDAKLEVMIHKPISHSIVKKLKNDNLLRITLETIEKGYKP